MSLFYKHDYYLQRHTNSPTISGWSLWSLSLNIFLQIPKNFKAYNNRDAAVVDLVWPWIWLVYCLSQAIPCYAIAAFRYHGTENQSCTILHCLPCLSVSISLFLFSLAFYGMVSAFLFVCVCMYCRCVRDSERAHQHFLPREPWPAKPF